MLSTLGVASNLVRTASRVWSPRRWRLSEGRKGAGQERLGGGWGWGVWRSGAERRARGRGTCGLMGSILGKAGDHKEGV